MPQTKIQGKFYALREEELIDLKEKKLINNSAYVYFALKIENPFCDRQIEIFPKQFALKWKIPEVSVYKAIAKLKELKLLAIKSGKVVISWIINSDNAEPKPVSEDIAVNELSDPIENYQKRKSIIKFDNELSDPINDYQIRENRGLKALADIAPACLQTIQNFHTNQTGGVEQNKFQEEEVNQERKVIRLNHQETDQSESKETKKEKNHKNTTKAVEEKDLPRDVTHKKYRRSMSVQDVPIDLRERLEELEIPLDGKVLKAITDHDISQAYGACTHIEDTWETINNPRGVFLFQIPKQKIEQLGSRLPEIGKQMRSEYAAIEEEMATDEYQKTAREAFAKMREKLGRGGKK